MKSYAATFESTALVSRFQEKNLGTEMGGMLPSGKARVRTTILSASGYGRGRSSTALTTVKMAVLAPIPSASVSTATAVNPGLFSIVRTA